MISFDERYYSNQYDEISDDEFSDDDISGFANTTKFLTTKFLTTDLTNHGSHATIRITHAFSDCKILQRSKFVG